MSTAGGGNSTSARRPCRAPDSTPCHPPRPSPGRRLLPWAYGRSPRWADVARVRCGQRHGQGERSAAEGAAPSRHGRRGLRQPDGHHPPHQARPALHPPVDPRTRRLPAPRPRTRSSASAEKPYGACSRAAASPSSTPRHGRNRPAPNAIPGTTASKCPGAFRGPGFRLRRVRVPRDPPHRGLLPGRTGQAQPAADDLPPHPRRQSGSRGTQRGPASGTATRTGATPTPGTPTCSPPHAKNAPASAARRPVAGADAHSRPQPDQAPQRRTSDSRATGDAVQHVRTQRPFRHGGVVEVVGRVPRHTDPAHHRL